MTASTSQPLAHSDSLQQEEHEGLLYGETSHERAHSYNYNSHTRSTSQDNIRHDDHDDSSQNDDEQPLLPAYTPSNMRYPPPPIPSSSPSPQSRRDHIHLNLNTPTGERQPDFDVDERRCRICFESEDDETSASGKLISPCLCKGSSRYIHLGCLEQWRALSPRKASAFSCDTCHYHYSVARPFMANILGHRWFLHAVTALMFAALCYSCSWFGHEVNARGLWEWKEIGRGGEEGGGGASRPELGTFLGLDYLDLVWGFVMVAAIGLVFLMVFGCSALCSEYTDDNDEEWCTCSGDSCSGCGLGALECNSGGGEGFLIIVAIIIFFTGIFGAFAGIYRIMAKYNRRALANMKEK
ncbi:hypothetical protein BGZ74_009672 [Mortierella antarctica]|nr:hypothetical protein BGZ74_009672 [Mortierella antarctica]